MSYEQRASFSLIFDVNMKKENSAQNYAPRVFFYLKCPGVALTMFDNSLPDRNRYNRRFSSLIQQAVFVVEVHVPIALHIVLAINAHETTQGAKSKSTTIFIARSGATLLKILIYRRLKYEILLSCDLKQFTQYLYYTNSSVSMCNIPF